MLFLEESFLDRQDSALYSRIIGNKVYCHLQLHTKAGMLMDARQRIIRATTRLLKQKGTESHNHARHSQSSRCQRSNTVPPVRVPRSLFQTVIAAIAYHPDLEQLTAAPLTYDLEADLLLFAKTFSKRAGA